MSNTTLGNTTSNASLGGDEPIRAGGTSSFSRPAALIGGAVALVALTAIATTIAVRQPAAEPGGGGGAAVGALAAQTLADKPPAAGPQAPAKEEIVEKEDAKADAAKAPAPKRMAAAKPAPHAGTGSPAATASADPAPAPARAEERVAAVCNTCGVVEAVTPYEKKGEGTGLGAVAGGVLGGVLGHQMGGGRGKDAMTAIGVVGGGIAGHEVEKRQRATTMYAVKVRMDDGSVRTINQSTAATVGQKVTVEGQAIKARA